MNWRTSIVSAQSAMETIEQAIADLTLFRDETTAEIAKYLRVDQGIELDIDAIRATLTRPYTLPPIAAKITRAQSMLPSDSANFVLQVVRYCWSQSLSPQEIAEARGLTGDRTISRWTTVCRAVANQKLLTLETDGRYRTNHAEIDRLKKLSEL